MAFWVDGTLREGCPLASPRSASRWGRRTGKQQPALPGGERWPSISPFLSTPSPLFFLPLLRIPSPYATSFPKGFKFCPTLIRESVLPGTWGFLSLSSWSPIYTGLLPQRKIQDCLSTLFTVSSQCPFCILVNPHPLEPQAMTVLQDPVSKQLLDSSFF